MNFPGGFSLSLGNIIAGVALLGGSIATYATLHADVQTNKLEIINVKSEQAKSEARDKENRREIRREIQEIKEDVKDINRKIDRLLERSYQPPTPRR